MKRLKFLDLNIARRTWPMNDENFSLKARRTTRIPLRIPVQLITEENGSTQTVDGWTMIVNVHGARIECKRPFVLHEEVLLQIPSNGKAQKGTVVWASAAANNKGNFEFGLELASPENLWGIVFPPTDWNTNRATAAAELGDPPIKAEPRVVSPQSDPLYTGEQCPVETPHQNQAAEPAGQPGFPAIPIVPAEPAGTPAQESCPVSDHAPRTLDLSSELLSLPSDGHSQPANGEQESKGAWPTRASEPERAGIGSNPVLEAAAAAPIAPPPEPLRSETPPSRSGLAAPASPLPGAEGNQTGQAAATDRLSAFFNELVESALQARLLRLMERLAVQVETRIAAVETSTLAHMEQQIHGVIAAQRERLEAHAAEVVMSRQQLVEQNLQKLRQEADADALRRHQETLQRAETLWTSVRQRIGQELPPIEKQFVEQCRGQTEQLLASRTEELDRRCSERSQEADQYVSQRMETIVEENTGRFVAQVEARSELLRAQACSQIEQQMDQITQQARQAFLRHVVTELKQKQQVWLREAQTELNALAEQKLERTRQSMSTVMKEFGEALIRGTYSEVRVPDEALSGRNGQTGVSETQCLDQSEGYMQPVEKTELVACNPDARVAVMQGPCTASVKLGDE
ncbi:MAG: hypothetical protein ACRD88_00125 [Terriglobia bacterium]